MGGKLELRGVENGVISTTKCRSPSTQNESWITSYLRPKEADQERWGENPNLDSFFFRILTLKGQQK